MDLSGNRDVKQFVEDVCRQVKWREVREEVALELESHILEIAEEGLEEGMPKDEAISQAIERMGEAEEVGRQLNKVHKPRPDWGLAGMTLLLTLLGLAVIYVMPKGNLDTFRESLKVIIPGVLLAGALYYLDYRMLLPYSKYIYCSTLVLCWLFGFSRDSGYVVSFHFNGLSYNFSGIVGTLSPFLLIVALAGIFSSYNWEQKGRLYLAAGLLFVPLILMIRANILAPAVIYSITFIVLAFASGAKLRHAAAYILSLVAGGAVFLYVFSPPWTRYKILAWLNPDSDPNGAGWLYSHITEKVSAAGFWGHGISEPWSRYSPLFHELTLYYVIYTFGWISALLLAGFIAAFLHRLAVVSLKTTDSYGRLLAVSITAVFSVKFIWNFFMNLGLMPHVNIGMPFISFGRVDFIVNMALVGLMLSIYRRRTLKAVPAKISGHSPA